MLDRPRKRFGDVIGGKASVLEEEQPEAEAEAPKDEPPPVEETDVEAVLLTRRESQKRESRLILTERIHNRAQVLLNEVRTDLLQEIHRRLEDEIPTQSLHNLLEVTFDTGFTARLDATIAEMTTGMLESSPEFAGDDEAAALFPTATRS